MSQSDGHLATTTNDGPIGDPTATSPTGYSVVLDATFQLLSYAFRIRTASASGAQIIERTLSDFRRPDGAQVPTYEFVEHDNDPGALFSVVLEERRLFGPASPDLTFNYLIWHIMGEATDRCTDLLLVHAGVASWNGQAVVLPAASGSGKTTLTAGLVRAGFSYLTDEVAALSPQDETVVPFPMALSIKPGSYSVLADLLPPLAPEVQRFVDGRRPLLPSDIRPGSVGVPVPVRLIVFPRYLAGAETTLTPMTRAEAVVELAHNGFNFETFKRRGFDLLCRLARSADCYRLRVGDLDEAVETIRGILDPTSARERQTTAV